MMPTEEQTRAHLSKIGVGMSKPIILYDQNNNMWAYRAAFVFKAWGFKDVHILEGGIQEWTGAKDKGNNTGNDTVLNLEFNHKIIKTLADVKTIVQDKSAQIVDARPAGGYQGGHIPGSLNVPMPALMNGATMKPAAECKAIFEAAGVDCSKPIVMTCGGGVMATVLQLAAAEQGCCEVSVFDGSWAEYSASM